MRSARMLMTLSAAAAVLAAACGQDGSPSGATGIGTPSSQRTAETLPLSRGYLEIGTYETEIFRPSFTIDIPVSSQWGTFGETGRRVVIGGQDGFFGFLALTTSGGQAPTGTAFVRTLRTDKSLDIGAVEHPTFSGLPATSVEVRTGPRGARVEFGGQHIGLPRRGRARLWLVEVGTARVMVLLAAGNATFASFSGDAMEALDSVRFAAA